MPLGEKEFHPYLNSGQIMGSSKLILGSFPVYACTDPDSQTKVQLRERNGTCRFFYGSHRSKFWNMYKAHIDNQSDIPTNINSTLKSLRLQKIAISDSIESCERIGSSAKDNQ